MPPAAEDKAEEAKLLPIVPKKKWISRNKILSCVEVRLPGEKVKKRKKRNKEVKGKVKDKDKDKDNDKDQGCTQGQDQENNKQGTQKSKFACCYCDKVFGFSSNLIKHERSHTGERPFNCNICDKKFISKFDVERHILTHSLQGGFPCDVCDKKLTTKEALVIHVRGHTGDLPYECPHCQKRFACKGGLNRHVRSHTFGKRYLCEECGKLFHSAQAVKIHLTGHTERTYNCDQCELEFKRRVDLKRHKLAHKAVLRLKCPLEECDRTFRRKDNLLRHLVLMHDQTKEAARDISKQVKEVDEPGPGVKKGKRSASSSLARCRKRKITKRTSEKKASLKKRKGKVKTQTLPSNQRGEEKGQLNDSIVQDPLEIQPSIVEESVDESDSIKRAYRTASVIRLAQSSTSYIKKKYRHGNNETHEHPMSSLSPPPSQPYPSRVPSPGQEYINYLNSLSNPFPYYRIIKTPFPELQQHVPEPRHLPKSSSIHPARAAAANSNSKISEDIANAEYVDSGGNSVEPQYHQLGPVPVDFCNSDGNIPTFSLTSSPSQPELAYMEHDFVPSSYVATCDRSLHSTEYERPLSVTVIKRAPDLHHSHSSEHDRAMIDPNQPCFNTQIEKDLIINRDPRKNFLHSTFHKSDTTA